MKKKLYFVLILFFSASLLNAQIRKVERAKDNHIFFHVDLAAGHFYTATFPSVMAWGLNLLTSSNIFESALEYPFYKGEIGSQKLELHHYNLLGFTANELFSNLHPCIKIGYQSRRFSDFNWGFYATAEYWQNQFQSRIKGGEYEKNNLQRALFGGSLFTVLGNIDKKYHVMIEGGLRYSMALKYKGPLAYDKDDIKNGLTSHFAVKLTGASAIQDFGVYVDINHFDLLKDDNNKLNSWAIGLMWTVTPGQSNNRSNMY